MSNRQSIGFSDPANAWLKAECERLGIRSISELVRRIVDEHRDRQTAGQTRATGEALGESLGAATRRDSGPKG